MKVLMLGTDQQTFNPASETRARMRDYAGLVDELWVVILGHYAKMVTEGNLKLLGLPRWRAWWWQPPKHFDLLTSQDPFENGLIAWCFTRRLGAKLQLQIHSDFLSPYFWRESFKNKIRVLLANFLLPRADGIRVVSQRIADSLKTNPVVLPIFVETEKIKNAPIAVDLHQKYPQFDKIILMASRLTREKNIGLAIKAMREVLRRRPKTGLIIVGSGRESEKLKAQSAKSGLKNNVFFESWVDHDTLTSYYKTADLFLLTSFYEGYGRTIIEALACGCSVISTDVGVAREAGAVIVGPDNLAQTIIECLVKPRQAFLRSYPYRSHDDYLAQFKKCWESIIAAK